MSYRQVQKLAREGRLKKIHAVQLTGALPVSGCAVRLNRSKAWVREQIKRGRCGAVLVCGRWWVTNTGVGELEVLSAAAPRR